MNLHMETAPEISVIIPVYNRKEPLRRALDSLLSQTYPGPYEIVVVDDGSTDDGTKLIEELDGRIRVIRRENGGAAAARLTGIQAARAKHVSFLDSDNVVLPTFLQDLFTTLDAHPNAVLAWGWNERDGGTFGRSPTGETLLSDPLLALARHGCFASAMNLLTTRERALACAFGRESFIAANDYDFLLRMSLLGPFACTDSVTMRAERLPDGISNRLGSYQVAFAVISLAEAAARSRRTDLPLRSAVRDRIELLWPCAFMKLVRSRRLSLALRVLWVGMCFAANLSALKHVYWTFSSKRSRKAQELPVTTR